MCMYVWYVYLQSEAEVGIIEKITLVNFMCHTMLEVPLGANVNFVIGRNGSKLLSQQNWLQNTVIKYQ